MDSPLYEGKILVPFSPGVPLSGVGKVVRPGQRLWYQRYFPWIKSRRREAILYILGRLTWSPESPVLYDVVVELGEDKVSSYFGLRRISVERDGKGILRVFLNGSPYFQNGLLDQGYYPEGLYTPLVTRRWGD